MQAPPAVMPAAAADAALADVQKIAEALGVLPTVEALLEALGKVADLQARLLGMAQAVIDAKRLAL